MRDQPPSLPVAQLVRRAWDRVRVGRRRELRQLARHWPIEVAADRAAPPPGPADRAAQVVIDGYRQGRLSLTAARAVWARGVAGWPSSEAAALLGCQPAALRARCSRAVRSLAA